jgi:hypothetical protein
LMIASIFFMGVPAFAPSAYDPAPAAGPVSCLSKA